MKNFIKTEKNIINIIEEADTFTINGIELKVLDIGKPTPRKGKGEPKTDVYLLCETTNKKMVEFKISIKQKNADFLENKISLDRAKSLFGEEAQSIIESSIDSIKNNFDDEYVYFEKVGKVEKGSITIGWKFELMNKISGKKSGAIALTSKQKIDVFSGTNICEDKKHSIVNGVCIGNSGVANTVLEMADDMVSIDDIFKNMRLIDEDYVCDKDIYFSCKAINYRTSKDKWDRNRPLSVYVNWKLSSDNLLTKEIIFSNPLSTRANVIGENIRHILKSLNINSDNFNLLKSHYIKED